MTRYIYTPVLSAILLCLSSIIFNAQAQESIKIAILGDSLTSGYQMPADKSFPKILEQKLLSDGYYTEIINMSVAGQTSSEAYQQINNILTLNPDIVIFQLGFNDAIRGIDLYKITHKNIFRMIDKAKQRGMGVVLLGVQAPNSVSKTYARSFDHMYSELGIYLGDAIPFYPNILDGISDRPDLTMADGIHPNEKGVLTMVHNLYPYIEPLVVWRINLQNYENSSR